MKREEIKVPISGKEEAIKIGWVLEQMGEKLTDDYWEDGFKQQNWLIFFDGEKCGWYCYKDTQNLLREITIAELIQLIGTDSLKKETQKEPLYLSEDGVKLFKDCLTCWIFFDARIDAWIFMHSSVRFKPTHVPVHKSWKIFKSAEKAKEFIKIENEKIIDSKKPKSIFTGKDVIIVNNEREQEILLDHYKQKKFEYISPNYVFHKIFPRKFAYENEYHTWSRVFDYSPLDYNHIKFEDFAKELKLPIPVPLNAKSGDGKDLYEGDLVYIVTSYSGQTYEIQVNAFTSKPYQFEATKDRLEINHLTMFFDLSEAEKFLKEKNKPKQIILFQNDPVFAVVTKDQIEFISRNNEPCDMMYISTKELAEVVEASKKLQ